jgi:hypothetical protein
MTRFYNIQQLGIQRRKRKISKDQVVGLDFTRAILDQRASDVGQQIHVKIVQV